MTAVTTAPALTVVTPQPRRHRWLRRAAWLVFALLLVCAFTAVSVLGSVLPAPLDITINGASLASGLDIGAMPAAHKLALASVAAVAVLLALCLTVAVLLVVAIALVPLLLLTVGLPVLVGGVVLLALFSPFLLLAWGLWLALRGPRPATMPA